MKRCVFGILSGVWGSCISLNAIAASWVTQEYLSLTSEYNDNFLLNVPGNEYVTTGLVDLGFNINRETELHALTINPLFKLSRYEGDFGTNSNDQYLYTSYQYDTERANTIVNLNYKRDTPLTSESKDSEISEEDNRRERAEFSSIWAYQLSELASTSVKLGYSNAQHEDSVTTGLYDYEYYSAAMAYSKAVTERIQYNFTLLGSRYKAKNVLNGADNVTDDAGIDISLDSKLSEKSKLKANYSWHESTVKVGPDGLFYTDTRRGRLYSLEATKQLERGDLKLSAQNEFKPSGSGNLERHDRYQLSLSYRFSERSKLLMSYLDTNVTDITDREGFVEWEYRQTSIQWSYKLFRDWFLKSVYRYTWKKFENEADYSKSNSVLISVQYRNS